MREKSSAASADQTAATRLAWWSAFFATVALIAILSMARSAQALTLPVVGPLPNPAAAALDPEAEAESEEGEEEEFESEECEEEEEEEGEECEEEDGTEAPSECLLSSASAKVSASTASDKLRLVVRYTTFSPASVAIYYFLRGSKGPLSLGGDRKHFARSGVFRQTETLSESQMAKVLAAKDFTVQLRPSKAPRYCHSLFDRHLTAKHVVAGGLSWSDPEASPSR